MFSIPECSECFMFLLMCCSFGHVLNLLINLLDVQIVLEVPFVHEVLDILHVLNVLLTLMRQIALHQFRDLLADIELRRSGNQVMRMAHSLSDISNQSSPFMIDLHQLLLHAIFSQNSICSLLSLVPVLVCLDSLRSEQSHSTDRPWKATHDTEVSHPRMA